MEKDKEIGDLGMKSDGTGQSISGPGMRVDRTEQGISGPGMMGG
jgi:hypothetical protein